MAIFEDGVYAVKNGDMYKITLPEPVFKGAKTIKLQLRPETNADRIRAMTDEELAQVVRNPCDIVDHYPAGWCKERNCGYKCALEWLKQEATDEHQSL